MIDVKKPLHTEWPAELDGGDFVKVRFEMDFLTSCTLQPADFLGLGRTLKATGRQFVDPLDIVAVRQWENLFQPPVSADPMARQRFQKPAPAFVISLPIEDEESFDAGDRLALEVLFVGAGIMSIRDFLRGLVHLGNLGLVAGEGRYEVIELFACDADGSFGRAWRQGDPFDTIACPVQKLAWFNQMQFDVPLKVVFETPVRILVDGKPLRKPRFDQIFPFMLRRVTSMLHAHCGVEIEDVPADLIAHTAEVVTLDASFEWRDWRELSGRRLSVGGFVGRMVLQGEVLEEVLWVLYLASLFGIGKGATYGAGRFTLGTV